MHENYENRVELTFDFIQLYDNYHILRELLQVFLLTYF